MSVIEFPSRAGGNRSTLSVLQGEFGDLGSVGSGPCRHVSPSCPGPWPAEPPSSPARRRGWATAHLFADEGANVVVADLGEERVAAVVDEIAAAHGADRVLGQVTDVADPAALRALVDATVGRFGGLDIVVNNAGISGVSSMFLPEDEFEDVWSRTLAVNLTAYARLVRLALPHLLESDGARIVNIASTEAIVATGGLPAYSATKAGVTGLTRNLAVELGRHGITANCICPGPINTGMTSSIDDSAKEI
ncbi:MAG: SDR family oxidoreductase [Ilumatobacteraceae bacterium]